MKTALTLISIFVGLHFSHAQNRNSLNSPQAKNYKAWKSDSKPTQVSTVLDFKSTYPNKKNKAIEKDSNQSLLAISTEKENRKVGLRSKNRNPWNRE